MCLLRGVPLLQHQSGFSRLQIQPIMHQPISLVFVRRILASHFNANSHQFERKHIGRSKRSLIGRNAHGREHAEALAQRSPQAIVAR